MDQGVNRVSKSLLLVETNSNAETSVKVSSQQTKTKKKETDKQERELSPRALFLFHLRFDTSRVLLQASLQYVGPPPLSALFSYKVRYLTRQRLRVPESVLA